MTFSSGGGVANILLLTKAILIEKRNQEIKEQEKLDKEEKEREFMERKEEVRKKLDENAMILLYLLKSYY